MGFILFSLLVGLAITLVDSYIVAFIAGLLGLDIPFKIIFFVILLINLFIRKGSN